MVTFWKPSEDIESRGRSTGQRIDEQSQRMAGRHPKLQYRTSDSDEPGGVSQSVFWPREHECSRQVRQDKRGDLGRCSDLCGVVQVSAGTQFERAQLSSQCFDLYTQRFELRLERLVPFELPCIGAVPALLELSSISARHHCC